MIATGFNQGRNVIKRGKKTVGLRTRDIKGIIRADSEEDAVARVFHER